MISLFSRLVLPKGIGLYIGDREVAGSRVAYRPLAPLETDRVSCPYTDDNLDGALEQVLQQLTGRRKHGRISAVVALSPLRTFFSTRPIQTKHSDPSPQVLLREAMRSPSAPVDAMTVDLIKAQPGRRPVASIAACQKAQLTQLLDTLRRHGVYARRIEPGPSALLRAGQHRLAPPRRCPRTLRVFLGDSRGIAMLAATHLPLVWRFFDLPRGDEAMAIVRAARMLSVLGPYCGLDAPTDRLVVHGRGDLRGILEFDWIQDQIGGTVEWSEPGGFTGSEIAFGAALGCFEQCPNEFDLARSIRSRVPLRHLFPWGETALQSAIVFCLGLLLVQQSNSAQSGAAQATLDSAKCAWAASQTDAQLDKQRRELDQKVSAVRRFLDHRIMWSSYLSEIPDRLPPNTFLTSFQGSSQLADPKKTAQISTTPNRSLVLRGATSIVHNGSMPYEVDGFLASMREHAQQRGEFPVVKLADLKQVQLNADSNPLAFFTLMCLPKEKPATPDAAPRPESTAEDP